MKKLLGIDGNSIMNRAFYGIMGRNIMRTTDGIYTNALYGFLAILNKTIQDVEPDYICVAFDLKAPTFRHQMYKEYKGTRKPMPDELRTQMPLIKDILNAMNIKILEIEGYEADDILGTISKIAENNNIYTTLLTGDRDYLQLVSKNTLVRIPTTKQGQTEYTDYTPEVVKEKFNIDPIQFIEIKGLMGDTSDNIPGVPEIGEKTAFSLITKYQTVDNIYKTIEENEKIDDIKGKLREKLEQNRDLANLSMELGTINIKVPLDIKIDDLTKKEVDNDSLYQIFIKLQFKNYIEKYNLKAPNLASNQEKESSKIEDFKYIEKETKDLYELISLLSSSKEENKELENNELTYYFKDSYLAILYNQDIYIKQNPTKEELEKIINNKFLKISYDQKNDFITLIKKGINISSINDYYKNEDVDSKLEDKSNIDKLDFFDIKIASYVLNPTKSSFKLDDIILEELGIMIKEEPKDVQLNFLNEISQDEDKNDSLKEKAIKYVQLIYACKKELIKKLKEKNEYNLFSKIEMPLSKVLAKMEVEGVLVDKNILKKYQIDLSNKVEELNKEIIEIAGEEFNVNSPKQLGIILFEKLKLPVQKKTKSGYSTDAETLEKLEDSHPIIEKILEYRTYSKLKSTYADGLLNLIKEDGRIHASFNQTVTATGRISCTDPNLQNIPIRTELGREFRKVFVAKENNKFIDADYSQIELRVLAHISEDKTMIQGFLDNQDVHKITASQVFEVPLDEVTKEMRSEAKAVNFGIVYGISEFGLGSNIGISRYKAKMYIEKYFQKYPGIKSYMDESVKKCKEKGYIETMWGRRRDVPEINAKNYNVRQFGERVAMNAPIQGTAADIIKIAMVNVVSKLEELGLKSKLLLQVHDELVLESPKDEVETAKKILVKEMQNVAKLKVPLIAEANIGDSWYEAK